MSDLSSVNLNAKKARKGKIINIVIQIMEARTYIYIPFVSDGVAFQV